jgi:hypothetical protein
MNFRAMHFSWSGHLQQHKQRVKICKERGIGNQTAAIRLIPLNLFQKVHTYIIYVILLEKKGSERDSQYAGIKAHLKGTENIQFP